MNRQERQGHKENPPRDFKIASYFSRSLRVSSLSFLCALCVSSAAGGDPEHPLTLKESVEVAWKHSPTARAARFEREAAQARTEKEKPVARPTVNATASGTLQGPRVTFPRPDGTSATVLPERFARLDLSVEQLLYRPGLGAARQRYAAQVSALELDYRKALNDLAFSVRKAYLEVLKAESGMRTAQDGLKAAQRYEAFVKKQIEAGLTKPVDAETAAGQVAEAQTGVTQAEGGHSLAVLNFNKTLGRPLQTPVTLEAASQPPPVPESVDSAIAVALEERPELLSLAQNLRAARSGVSLAKTQAQPSLSVRGQFVEQTPTAFLPQNYLAATLELRWPILDGGKARADTREARAQVGRLEALLEEARQGIALDVTQAWQKMREAKSRISQTETQLKSAEAAGTVAEKAYEVGRGTALEVQAAQREVRAAREKRLQATYDLETAAAEFAHAQGRSVAP